MVNVLDCDIVSEFKLLSCFYDHFQTNILEKYRSPLSFIYILKYTTTIIQYGSLLFWINNESWYTIDQRSIYLSIYLSLYIYIYPCWRHEMMMIMMMIYITGIKLNYRWIVIMNSFHYLMWITFVWINNESWYTIDQRYIYLPIFLSLSLSLYIYIYIYIRAGGTTWWWWWYIYIYIIYIWYNWIYIWYNWNKINFSWIVIMNSFRWII